LLIAILAIKAVLFALDAEPSFHLQDSAVYLATAIGKWIPPDRSFFYGLLLRPIALWPRSLTAMVLMQATLSGIASWLIAVCLLRYFAVGFRIAALCSIACALEPLQLVAERYVATESVATFVFAVLLLAIFSYLKTSSLSLLALIQILAVLLVSLRVSFVPLAWIISFFIPLASRRAVSFWRSSAQSLRRMPGGFKWLSGTLFVLLSLLLSVGLSQSLLFGYRHLYGELLDRPPAYTYRAGSLMAADVPRVEPFRLLKMAVTRYGEFLNAAKLRRGLQVEQGQFVDALPGETQAIQVAFGIDVKKQSFTSLTRKWEQISVFWCWVVILLPAFYLLYLAVNWRRIRVPHITIELCGLILLVQAVVPVEYPSPRYLTTLAWLEFIMIGSLGTRLLKRGE